MNHDEDQHDSGEPDHNVNEGLGAAQEAEGWFSGGWVLFLLGLPFIVFECLWPSAHWAIRLLAFILTFLVFCGASKDVLRTRSAISSVLSLPWYLPLVVLIYPTLVLNYLAPDSWWGFQVLAFASGFPLGWKYYDYIECHKPLLWQCDNCGRRVWTKM